MEQTKLATLIYLIHPVNNTVIMAKKTRKVGVGYWFGYGGKIEPGQSADECICEETKDESGGKVSPELGITLDPEKLERVALIDFYKGNERPFSTPNFRVLCYRTFSWTGDAISTDEMLDPTPFPLDDIPWNTNQMKPGDELFVPQILAGIRIKGWVRFSEDSKTVLGHHIESCSLEDLVI